MRVWVVPDPRGALVSMHRKITWPLPGRFLRYWFPAFLWIGVIGFFSTDAFASQSTFSYLHSFLKPLWPDAGDPFYIQIHAFLRKLAHPVEYFVLGLLVYRGFRSGAGAGWRPHWAVGTLLMVTLVSAGDEWHQYHLATRRGAVGDVLLDVCGGGAAVLVLYLRRHRR